MIRLACAFAFAASPLSADSARTWAGTPASGNEPSFVEIHAPTAPDAAATVTFQNTPVHGMDETFALQWQGIGITVLLDWQADDTQAERITVEPPAGYVAIPWQITVNEGATGVLHIVKYEGM